MALTFLKVENASLIEEFREILSGGMVLGPLIARKMPAYGMLSVLVPEDIQQLLPGQLKHGIKGLKADFLGDFYSFCELFFYKQPSPIIVADTSRRSSDANNASFLAGLRWFSCESPWDSSHNHLCAYLTSDRDFSVDFPKLMRISNPYPTTIILASLPTTLIPFPGGHYKLGSEFIRYLTEQPLSVAAGVLDECSMAIWQPRPINTLEQPVV